MGEDDQFKVKISKINLFVIKCEINQSVQLAYVLALQQSAAKYPIRPTKLLQYL